MREPLHFDGQPPEGPAQKVRFGPYEADLRAGVLRKHDIRIRLAEQPFRVLARLVRSPGELVTREELIELLWPEGTYVEFERSLNAAVKKLRRALNDSPTDPNFVQTLPKKGYRFIAPVEVVAEAKHLPFPAQSEAAGRDAAASPTAEEVAPAICPFRPRFDPARAAVVAIGVVIALGLLVLLRETGSNGGSSSVEAGPVRLDAVVLPGVLDQGFAHALSPDGTSVAFSWNGGADSEDPKNVDIYIQRLDGGDPVRVTSSPGRDLGPSWSPDGLRIALWRQWPAPAPGTYVISLRDTSEIRVMGQTRGPPSWTPDGKWLVGSEEGSITAVSIESSERRELVKSAKGTGVNSDATVSPDGKFVAFAGCPDNSGCDLYLQPWEGGQPRQLTFERGGFGGVAWTPDSKAIVYSLDGRIFRIAVDDNRLPQPIDFVSQEPLPGRMNSPTIARFPKNGSTRMIFRHSRLRDADIWETDIAGGAKGAPSQNSRKLVDSPGLDSRPAYSPDGRKIAFESQQNGEYGLWVCDRDGSNRRKLTDSNYRVNSRHRPAWSHDSRQIAFRASTPSDKAFHIYTVAVEGGIPRRVTSGEDETTPAWSRDGWWIYFVSKRSGQGEIWKAPSNGSGPPVPVSNTHAWSFAESPDDRFVYFCGAEKRGTPYGSLFRVPVEGGSVDKLLQPFSFFHVEFHGEDLYFLDHGYQMARGGLIPLKKLDVRTKQVSEVAQIKDPGVPRIFSLSPDGRSVLTWKMGPSKAEMMLVEDLR